MDTFLESYKTSCDHNQVGKGLVMQILPYVIESQAKLTRINCFRLPEILYTKTINVLLSKYASNEKILQTIKVINEMSQLLPTHPSDFVYYEFSRTNHCGCAYEQDDWIQVFLSSAS